MGGKVYVWHAAAWMAGCFGVLLLPGYTTLLSGYTTLLPGYTTLLSGYTTLLSGYVLF